MSDLKNIKLFESSVTLQDCHSKGLLVKLVFNISILG